MSAAYKAFISYAHRDAAWARKIQRQLEDFRAPASDDPKHPLRPVFLDRTELSSSPRLSDSIEKALRGSEALIVVCSPAAAQSKWVNEEILYFRRLGREAVFPVIVAGEPESHDVAAACFPPALRYELGADGELTTQVREPLAADARSGNDGRDAVLKLISGLLDVPFDTLKLRQQKRRIRQMLAFAGTAAAMVVLTSYLAITAVIARQDAERNRQQAEDLISYMLGDLRERLEPVGRLDVLDGVGEKALEYFAGLSAAEQTADSMLTRATALRQIGEVRVAQGLFDEALEAFDEALTTLQSSAGGDESVRLFEIGQINFWIADAYFRELELESAHSHIEEYLRISRELVRMEPDNPDFQLESLYAESNLGTLALRAGDTDAARDYFNNALAMARRLSATRPGEDSDFELAETISWLGALEATEGRLRAAIEHYEEVLSLRRRRLAAADDPTRRHDVARTLWLLAETRQQLGQPAQAYAALSESAQMFRELASYDPLNFDWQRQLAWTLTLLSGSGFASGHMTPSEALDRLETAATVLARITGDDTVELNRVAAAIDTSRSRISLMQGHPESAFASSDRAATVLQPLLQGSDRIRVRYLYAEAAYLRSESRRAGGDEAAAMTAAEEGLRDLGPLVDEPIQVYVFAALLARRARLPQADEWLSRVAASDYRALAYVPDSGTEAWWHERVPAP
jgi:tetratricopeptide (TPR) repeat protein